MMDAIRRSFPLLLSLVAALAVGACATAGAKGQGSTASLEVPPPPARVIVPAPPPLPETPPPTGTITDKNLQPPVGGQRGAPASKPTAKPTTPADPAQAAAATVAPPPATPPAPTLEQPAPAKPDEIERQVKDTLLKAKNDLDRVDYTNLNKDGRTQYDAAKRFIEEANQALLQKNFVYAAKVAEKAAGLAAGLPR